MKYKWLQLFIMIAALWIFWPAQAAEAADVVMGGHVVFRVGNEKQAENLSRKLEALLQSGASGDTIKVVRKEIAPKKEADAQNEDDDQEAKPQKKFIYSVYWGKELIIDVTDEMAKQSSSSSESLARLWVENLRKVTAIGLLNLDTSKVIFPVDGGKYINVGGLATGEIKAEEPAGVVEIDIDQENGKIYIKAKKVGKSKLTVFRGVAKESVFIQVKDWAGTLPKEVVAEVTGSPAQADIVAQAVMLSIVAGTETKPGCFVYIDDSNFLPIDVPSGDTMRIVVPAGITASEDYFEVSGRITVSVVNVPVEPVEQNLLLVSNRPERIDKDGILLKYTFNRREPTRLMYSHLNASERNRHLWVNLFNLSETPLKIVISPTHAGPEKSEIYVGQTAAKRFLTNLAAQSGYIVTLSPRSALQLVSHDMRKDMLVSGFINFQILEGSSAQVEVRTASDPNGNDGRVLPELGAPFNPFKIHPHGVFAQPYFEFEGDYEVDGKPLTFVYGESPWLIDFETGLPNTGNFGVLYKTLIEFKNPTRRTRTVGLYFKPLSGPGGANFLIGNKVYQAVFRKKDDEVLVAKIELGPNSSNLVEIITLPEATSCYPAQYELRDL